MSDINFMSKARTFDVLFFFFVENLLDWCIYEHMFP